MSLNLSAKKAIVADIVDIAKESPSIIAAEYTGLTAEQMTELRCSARQAGVYLKVVRNTLSRRAFENTQFKCMSDNLAGPLLLAFANHDPGSAARVVRDFAKDNDKLTVKLIALDGKLLPPSELSSLANIPSLTDARAMLLGVLAAPLRQFVSTLLEPPTRSIRVMTQRSKKNNE